MRFPCVAGAVLRPFANRRRLSAGVGPGRSRAAGRRGRLSFDVMFPAVPDARCMASPGVANRVAGREARGSVCHRKSRWAGGQAGTRADAATPGPRCSPSWPGAANTVTVRDSKRFGEPLALPRSCPPYVRDQWISRTHDRILRWHAPSDRTCNQCRSGGMFSQVRMA